MPDIIITPSSGIIDFFPVSARVGRIEGSGNTINISNPSGYIAASGSGLSINTSSPNATLHAFSSVSGATLFNLEGTNGSLFSVVDNLSGSLMSVNNNAGLPVFEVFSDDRIIGGRFGQNDFVMTSGGNIGIGTGVPSSKFHVVGTSTFGGDISSTGSFIAGSGSAGNPSFEFVDDTDTGMFSPAANTIGLSTSGVERLRIIDAGRVGIGTSVPQAGYILDINGATVNRGNFLLNGNVVEFGNSRYQFHSLAATNSYSWVCNGGGNFGVGFSAPSGRVAISGGVSIGSNYNLTPPTNGLIVEGNVGIGTTTPSGHLDVAGDVYVRGTGNNLGIAYFKSQAAGDKTLYLGATNGGDLVLNGGGANIQLSSQGGYLNILGFSTQIHIGHGYNAGNTTQLIRFLPAATEIMRMTTSGTVGIGLPTSSASYAGNAVQLFSSQPYANTRVHIAGSGSTSASAALIVTNSGIDPILYVRNDRTVGINTNSPSGQLHVVGSGIFSSGVYINNIGITGNMVFATNTNGNLIIKPNGSGSLQADDSGNSRGLYSVDLQMSRTSASGVAGGNYSVVAGGYNNSASGLYSVVCGGDSNIASGNFSTINGGKDTLSSLYGEDSRSSGKFNQPGDAQVRRFISRNIVSSTENGLVFSELFLDGQSLRITIPDDATWFFTTKVVIKNTNYTESAAYKIEGVIERSPLATLLLVYNVTTLWEDYSSQTVGCEIEYGEDGSPLFIIILSLAPSAIPSTWYAVAYTEIVQVIAPLTPSY